MKKIFIIAVSIIVSACSATGPLYKEMPAPNNGTSDIYIYRPSQFINSVISPGISLNNKELILLENGAYTVATVNPGKHTISVLLSDRHKLKSTINVETRPNSKSYVKLITEYGSGNRAFYLQEVPKTEAIKEISETVYIDPKDSDQFEKSYIWTDN